MPIKRHQAPAVIATVPRSTLAHVHHKEIDAILKDLRICSRSLKSVLDDLNVELRTLERLYYKSKNQHRAALFFKRVLELRRYGRRLSELSIPECVDILRASFVGLEHANDQKALRGTWGHVPEKPYVYFLMERLTSCSSLVCKMRERLDKGYHHFVLAMQSGAFVQLVVLFIAISSRMSVLSLQLEEALQLSISTCNRLLPTSVHATVSRKLSPKSETPPPSYIDRGILSEDTGQLVCCREPINTSTLVVENLNLKTGATSETRVTPQPSQLGTSADERVFKEVSVRRESRRKKVKKRFDEIDEIFGF